VSFATLYPTEVRRLPEAGRLRLTWSDGHVAEYDYAYLRGYCPCAACQGHTNEAIHFHRPPASVAAEAIEPVGNYAISIRWSDGHATGIYRFDFLRLICPCDQCAREGTGEGEEPPPVERM
jgi:DUF971 family protein